MNSGIPGRNEDPAPHIADHGVTGIERGGIGFAHAASLPRETAFADIGPAHIA